MPPINPRIPNNFKDFSEKNPDFPSKMIEMLNTFLDTASRDNIKSDTRENLFDKIAENYVENEDIVNWCEKYD